MLTANQVPLKNIARNPNQPRKTFDAQSIQELAQSIQENELLQPILVEDNQDGTYTLVGGERRLRAFELLGRESIPATVRERSNHGGRELLIHAVIENVQREDMNPIDEAEAYQRLRDEFSMTWVQVSLKTGKSVSRIGQLTTLLKLDPPIRELIRAGRLSHLPNLARALQNIPDADARIKLAQRISQSEMSIKQGIAAAEKIAEMYGGSPLKLGALKSPAMKLAKNKSYEDDLDETTPPSGWNALKQVGKVPAWTSITKSVTAACEACTLASMANASTCKECPLVDFLSGLVRMAT